MDPRRAVPAVDQVARRLHGLPHALLVDCARDAVDDARQRVAATTSDIDGQHIEPGSIGDEVARDAQRRADRRRARRLHPMINATGVLLHTNLGRAALDDHTLGVVQAAAAGASNLEFDVETGRRGSRHEHAGTLLARACGAAAGLVVNNNAAAVLLVLTALARGRDVIVSRGELVEIGGGFRIPEVLEQSGATLVEVGTTNRTRIADYRRALTPETSLLLRVHASNYRMVGFVESAPIAQLATLGPPVVFDVGSGLLDEATPWLPTRPGWLGDEPGVRQALEAGAALVTFSGDKLLGGPQAGVVVGRADLVDIVSHHPLARAVRADKMTLAALESVADAYLDGDATRLLLWRRASTPLAALRRRAEQIASAVPVLKVVDTESVAGGGSLPGLTIPSVGVALPTRYAESMLARLRALDVVARVDGGNVVCDLRSVDPREDAALTTALGTLTDADVDADT